MDCSMNMNKKGFTLVELLAVVVILAIILAIAVPAISTLISSSSTQAYQSNEKMIAKAAKTYLGAGYSSLPTDVGYGTVVQLTDLVSNNFMNTIVDVKNTATSCTGYVVVGKKSDGGFEYTPFIKCGTNYETKGYQSTNLSISKVFLVEILIVAGGGGGAAGAYYQGGGGAGGLIYHNTISVLNGANSIVVGSGGAIGAKGQDSSAFGLTAFGGGNGGNGGPGISGGSGGGGGCCSGFAGGAAVAGQGNAGGWGFNSSSASGGGGGGAGSNGANGIVNSNGAAGGIGLQYSISGTATYYAGGGGGGVEGASYTPGVGGLGGGGNGSRHYTPIIGTAGAANTGGGGGGGAAGGSGIVIIRYPGSAKATGGTITTVGSDTVHTFTASGTFSPTAF